MWELKKFRTAQARDKWIAKHGHAYQIVEVFINQATSGAYGYALEVRKLRIIG